MTKAIFADFDGPFTNNRIYTVYDRPLGRSMWTTGDPVVVEFLNSMYRKYSTKVVISSTWRLTALTPTKLSAKESLRSWGFEGEFHEDWETKYFPELRHNSRKAEIWDWIVRHAYELETWVSLDDEPLPKHLNPVRAHVNNGYTDHRQFGQMSQFIVGGGWNIEMLKEKGLL